MGATELRTPFTALTPDTVAFPPQGFRGDVAERITFIPPPPPPIGSSRKEPKSAQGWLLALFRDNQGLLLIGASQFFGPCMNISVQMLNRLDPPVPPTEMLVVRQTITWTLTVAYMRYQGVSHPITGPPEVRLLLVIRGVCGFFGVFGMYYSLQYLSLSDAVVLTFLSPFFTSFSGTFFLGEPFSRRNLFAGVCSLVGVVLIARPEALFGPSDSTHEGRPDSAERGTAHQRLLAVVVSIVGVFGASGAYTSLRAIGTRAHTLHSMMYFTLFSGIISAILMLIGRTKFVLSTDWKWGALMASITAFGFMAQLLLIMGLRKETASRGSLAMYIQIVFASMLERIFFHVTPSILSLTGTAIILSSAIYVVLTKTNPKDEQSRRQTESETASNSSVNRGATEQLWEVQMHTIHPPEEQMALLEEGEAVPDFVSDDSEPEEEKASIAGPHA